ncbi:ABC transporter permease [Roseburia sp. 499]|uniref:ABC transporter permease n=1 Tax=Roseburia sp. 499 TaxID=1261634 RepID=UPI000952CD6B|nr:FtsX-like permease family protein [Roseburia sp. 499]WVK68807.1 ABC transporter permease [Roseburia sp. 499]
MFFNILKKDLKRKKTMNVILLIFIAMASMFVSSSVNNMVSILNATENYFDRAELKDYYIIAAYEEKNEQKIQDFLNTNSYVEDWDSEELLSVPVGKWEKRDGKELTLQGAPLVQQMSSEGQKFFNSENQKITHIGENEMYLPLKVMETNNLKSGDSIYLCKEDKKTEFVIAGSCKDALLGADMMGSVRILVSKEGYEKVKEYSDLKGMIYSVSSEKPEKLEEDFNQEDIKKMFSGNRELIKMTYVMDMVVAGLLLVVSICLIVISMIILRFTIVFTLNEEFREIGVMKAIGVSETQIRGIYLIKYLMIAAVGAGIGFFAGIPFGKMLLAQVSRNMVMETEGNIWLLSLACALVILLVVVLFCYRCTGRLKKFSPIDAIREGSNGERFTKKGLIKLEKWHGGPVSFLAFNDILSKFRSFVVLLLIFTIGILLIIVPVNTANTLKSDKLVAWFGMQESDICMLNEEEDNRIVREEGREGMKDNFKEMEEKLKKQGIPVKVSQEIMFNLRVSFKEKSYNAFCLQGTGNKVDGYKYEEGTAPKYANEIAITRMTAGHIGAEIGDTVTITMGEEKKEFVITGYFQSMNNMGEGIRFSEKAEIDYSYTSGSFARQLTYTDEPDEKEKAEREEKIADLYPDYTVYTCGEYLSDMMGGIADTLDAVKQLIVIVIMAINMLVTILVSKTFLAKERGEIGMLKAIGFNNPVLIRWQVLRIGVILVLSVILGALLATPVAQISSGKVFEMMGATHIEFVIKPFEVYVEYPLLVLAATLVGAFISMQQIRSISAQETNNIE